MNAANSAVERKACDVNESDLGEGRKACAAFEMELDETRYPENRVRRTGLTKSKQELREQARLAVWQGQGQGQGQRLMPI